MRKPLKGNMKFLHSSVVCAALVASAHGQAPTFDDAWDTWMGALVTGASEINPDAGNAGALLGDEGQDIGFPLTWTYFADGKPENFVHYVEWETPENVTVGQVRVFAWGENWNNYGYEFDQMVIRAKSAGSDTYDVTVIVATPPFYDFIDWDTMLVIDQAITPVTARYFRAEFVTTSSVGPHILEIDGIAGDAPPPPPPPPPVLPVIAADPESVVGNIYMPVALTVDATGTGALRFQWFKDGTAIEGQNSWFLMIPSLSASDVASYHVAVTDDVGTVTSADATVSLDYANMVPAAFDLWDVRMGASLGAHSVVAAGSDFEGMFGGDVTEFASQGPGAVHFVEWSVPAPMLVRTVRLFAHGDGLSSANLHEFGSFTLRAKSPGSAAFDIVVGTFTPAHPYPLLDANTFAILDTEIAPVTASEFRAEFTQYNGGPRVLELDAFGTRPLVKPGILVGPASQTVQRNANATLSVAAKGGNLQFQWKLNGQAIAGATGASLNVLKMSKRDEGSYTVVVSNELGSAESAPAVLTIPTGKK